MPCRQHRASSSHIALKPLAKKQLSAWRPITARLILLRKLVTEFGLEGGSGLAADAIMGFIQVRHRSAVSVGLQCPTRTADLLLKACSIVTGTVPRVGALLVQHTYTYIFFAAYFYFPAQLLCRICAYNVRFLPSFSGLRYLPLMVGGLPLFSALLFYRPLLCVYRRTSNPGDDCQCSMASLMRGLPGDPIVCQRWFSTSVAGFGLNTIRTE